MSRGRVGAFVLGLAVLASHSPGAAQWFTPQSDRLLRLNWTAQRLGPSRVLIVGEIRNLSDLPASQVVLRAEGLNEAGRVISRARGYVGQSVPPRASSPFEIRLIPAGAERSYRVRVESFEFHEPARERPESP